MAREGRSAGPWILIGLGAVLGVVAVIGLVADLGAETTSATSEEASATTSIPDETTSAPTTEAPTTEAPTTAASTTEAPPTTAAPETPEEFLADLAVAFRSGDVEFKLAKLHPAVIERFGEELCRTYLSSIAPDTTADFVVVSVSEPADYDWTLGDETTTVPDTLSVEVTRTANGVASPATVHLTPVDGELRWYTDCSA